MTDHVIDRDITTTIADAVSRFIRRCKKHFFRCFASANVAALFSSDAVLEVGLKPRLRRIVVLAPLFSGSPLQRHLLLVVPQKSIDKEVKNWPRHGELFLHLTHYRPRSRSGSPHHRRETEFSSDVGEVERIKRSPAFPCCLVPVQCVGGRQFDHSFNHVVLLLLLRSLV